MSAGKLIVAATMVAHLWYPHECCDDGHCHPVLCSEITIDKDTYPEWNGNQGRLVYHGHHFRMDREMESQDGGCHVCMLNEGGTSEVPLCIFTPKGPVS